MIPTHSFHGMISSMLSRNSSLFVFFFRQLYSISLKLSCFIPFAPYSSIISLFPAEGKI